MSYNPAKDQNGGNSGLVASQARAAFAVTPNDDDDFDLYAKGLYIGAAGDVAIIPVTNDDNDVVILYNHPIGYVPIQVRRVLATGTSADSIVGLLS